MATSMKNLKKQLFKNHEEEETKTSKELSNNFLVVNSLKGVLGKKKNSIKYEVIKRIGAGQFGCVYVCKDINQKELALKKIKLPDESAFNNAINEYQITQSLNHENVIKFYDFYLENVEEDMVANIIMEYCPLNDLHLLILEKSFDNKTLLNFALQILKGIAYIHENKLIHRDLKPENILIALKDDQFIMKIADFGLIKKDEQSKHSIAGTMKYMSPEMMKGDKYTNSTDIFSFGGILYFICLKHDKIFVNEIFKENFRQETKEKLESGSFHLDISKIIFDCLSKDPEARPTAQKLLERIQIIFQE